MHPRDGYIVCPNCPFVCTPHKEHSRCPWCAFQTLSRCICGAAIKVPLDAHCSECGKLLRKKPDISDAGEAPSLKTPQIKLTLGDHGNLHCFAAAIDRKTKLFSG